MRSVTAHFDELLERVRRGRDFRQASFEPVYYLVHDPCDTLEVKRLLPAWRARLVHDGWKVFEFSIAREVLDLCQSAPTRHIWLKADATAPLAWARTNASITNALRAGQLTKRLGETLERASADPHGLVLVTDLEALHPYLRIGAIETELYGKFTVPTIILYPGVRTGKTRLSFLGFCPDDGNYRSVHVGG